MNKKTVPVMVTMMLIMTSFFPIFQTASAQHSSDIESIDIDVGDYIEQIVNFTLNAFELLTYYVVLAVKAPFNATANIISDWSDSLGAWGWLAPVMMVIVGVICGAIIYFAVKSKDLLPF